MGASIRARSKVDSPIVAAIAPETGIYAKYDQGHRTRVLRQIDGIAEAPDLIVEFSWFP